MKNVLTFLFALLLFSPLTSLAQSTAAHSWAGALSAQLERVQTAKETEERKQVVATIERIALANAEAWLPNYYAAHFNLIQHWSAGEEGCKPCLEKVDAFIAKAEEADNNSEVMTLRASYYQAMLGMHPMRAPYYGPKAGSLLDKAVEADPNNPRAASLKGQNLYYTPSMWGGGADKALPYLEKAVALFAAEETNADRDKMLPVWGAGRASYMYDQAKEATGVN